MEFLKSNKPLSSHHAIKTHVPFAPGIMLFEHTSVVVQTEHTLQRHKNKTSFPQKRSPSMACRGNFCSQGDRMRREFYICLPDLIISVFSFQTTLSRALAISLHFMSGIWLEQLKSVLLPRRSFRI